VIVPRLAPELTAFFNNRYISQALGPSVPEELTPPKMPTGVQWLDDFLEGGLADGRVNILDWGEGTEKLQELVLDSLFRNFLGVSGEESAEDLLVESKKYRLVVHPFKLKAREATSFFPARGTSAPMLVLSCLEPPRPLAVRYASALTLRFTPTQVRVNKDMVGTRQARICEVPEIKKKSPMRSRFNRPPVV
jgi:hypothetical protein